MGGRYMRALAYVALALVVTVTSCQASFGATPDVRAERAR